MAARRVHCIVQHDEGSAAADLAHDVLAVAPAGQALYAANPVTGRMVAVRGGLPYGPRTWASLRMRASAPQSNQSSAALAANGHTLCVATGAGVWVVDTRAFTVRGIYLPGQMITSVALSPDGQRRYALTLFAPVPGQGITVLDPARGRVLGHVAPTGDSWASDQVIG